MSYTHRFTEDNELLANIVPAAYTSVQETARVKMADYQRAVAKLHLGATTQAVDAKIRQHNAASGGTSKDVTGKAITQFSGTDDNKSAAIELRTEELDVDGGFQWISFLVTPAGSSATFYAEILGFVARFKPVPTTPWAQIVD